MNLSEVIRTAQKVTNVAAKADQTVSHYKRVEEYKQSEAWEKDIKKAHKIQNITDIVFIFFLLLWLVIIIATIVLCVKNNDIVLTLLHL
jgi:type IV secretory pathway component VirB8